MKFTQEQVINIIKEEIAAVLREEVSYADPRFPIAMVKLFLADVASPNTLPYAGALQISAYRGRPEKDVAALQDLPRTRPPVNEKALDIFDQLGLPSEVTLTIDYAIENSGVDEKMQSYMKRLFIDSDTAIYDEVGDLMGHFTTPEVIKLAQVLLESLNKIQIPDALDLDVIMRFTREVNPELADRIEGELS